MVRMRVLVDNGFYPAKLMKMFNISLDEWGLIMAAPDRKWLVAGASKRGYGALHGYDSLTALTDTLVSM